MKSHRITILVVAAALILLGAVAVSQTVKRAAYEHGPGMFGGRMFGFYARRLNLSNAQRAQMKDILSKEKPNFKPLLQQLGQSNHQMRQLVEAGTFDETQARALATQQSQTLTELLVQKARVESEMLQVLTPDQKAQFKDMMDRHEQRMMNHLQTAPAGADKQ